MNSENIVASIEVLGAQIKAQKDDLFFDKVIIDDLKIKLEEAQKEIERLKEENNKMKGIDNENKGN